MNARTQEIELMLNPGDRSISNVAVSLRGTERRQEAALSAR
jgi:hypothetical protein